MVSCSGPEACFNLREPCSDLCLAFLICTSQQRPLTSGVRLIAMSLLTPLRGKGSCMGYSNPQAGHAVRSQLIQRSPRLAKRSTRNASRDCGGLSRFVSSEVPPRSVAHSQSVPSIRQRPKLKTQMHCIFFADRNPHQSRHYIQNLSNSARATFFKLESCTNIPQVTPRLPQPPYTYIRKQQLKPKVSSSFLQSAIEPMPSALPSVVVSTI